MSSDELTRWLDEEVYPKLTHEQFFSHLDGFRPSGSGFVACCPNPDHDDKHPSFYMPNGRPFGFCYACGYKVTWWQILEAKGFSGRQVIVELARMAGVPPLASSSEDPERVRQEAEKNSRIEEWWHARRLSVWQAEGEDVLDYLRGRGYTDDLIQKMDVGVHPGSGAVVPGDLCLPPPDYRLVIPIRSRGGCIVGFAGRRLDDGEPKYQYSKGLAKSSLLLGQHRIRKNDEVIVVEGVMDVESLAAAGIPYVVSLGGAQASGSQLDLLAAYRRVILALDADDAGKAGTEKLVRELSTKGIKTYVVELRGAKDPDELLRRDGAAVVREAIRRAAAGHRWLVRRSAPGPGAGDLERDDALYKILVYAERLTFVDPVAARETLNEVAAVFGLTEASLAQAVEQITEKRQAEYRRRRWEEALEEANKAASEGKIDEIPSILREAQADVAAATEPPPPEPVDFAALEGFLAAFPPGLESPWEALNNLVRVDSGGMTVVGAGTSHGKSTFIYNLLLHWLQTYPNGAIVLWSGEIAAPIVWSKLLGILGGAGVIDVMRHYKEGLYIPGVGQARSELVRAAEGRLFIFDDPVCTEILSKRVKKISEKQRVLAVMVDYLQMVEPPGKVSGSIRYGTREQEVTAVAKALHDLAVELNTAVVAAAQISRNNFQYSQRPRLTDLRESGGIEHYAQMVLGLWNSTMVVGAKIVACDAVPAAPKDGWYWTPTDIESETEDSKAAIAMAASHGLTLLEVNILKSRLRGNVGKSVPLALHGLSGRISDLPTDPGTCAVGSTSAAAATPANVVSLKSRRKKDDDEGVEL